jgi:enoyl-CoA hydratase
VTPTGVTGRKRKKPPVTAVNGNGLNVGLELALASDICVAANDARFAFHEVRFGVYPFGGGLFRFIRAAGWNAAMRYCLTAEEFGAAEALTMNLAASVWPGRSPRKSAAPRHLRCRQHKRKAGPTAAAQPPSRIRFRTSSGF